jgi:hypothetical protein
MSTERHPITPPPELVERLQDLGNLDAIALAYQAGADQELEACCDLLTHEWGNGHGDRLHRLRHPKPPSLKEQALDRCNDYIDPDGIIRRALEALPDG